ncbi:MAG: DEAD/DEAH box helicase family protein [Candidatus Poribacteria bacterium]|nr:DEAD/DEAH box helicase family protein [Candidatus Poribacteria bacterium]
MLELKTYQRDTLDAFSNYLEVLEKERQASETVIENLKQVGSSISDDVFNEVRNYPKTRPIPHVCFKVPTGGGKTLLAASALERLHRQRGLTLWVVPTQAIYDQTKAALWNKEHPYRKVLERASGGRVKMLEREETFNRDDTANYLCVMLLMLPAANKSPDKKLKDKAYYRMYRNSGRYSSFFPDHDDKDGNALMKEKYPDLDPNPEGDFPMQSLFNVIKILRPVVVLDEAHKAYGTRNGKEFASSINRLDPQMVIELSATPNSGISNLLVDIGGPDLKKEEMIKSPVQVSSYSGMKWQDTLREAATELERLDSEARSLESNTERYIRPIAVVRVERTGKDQRDNNYVHAEDVRDYLTQHLKVRPDAVRVKSATQNELQGEDLLSKNSQVKWIITKAALMEGWDCSFAYLLVVLDKTRSQNAITQLVGRVMRQPHAQLTGKESLDQCYVFCNDTDVDAAVTQVKKGVEKQGLTGLEENIFGSGNVQGQADFQMETVRRRKPFRGQEIYLPVVRHKDGDEWIQLNYQAHISPHIDWDRIKPLDPNASAPDGARLRTATVAVDDVPPVFHEDQEPHVEKNISVSEFALSLSDIVPNPWQAARIAEELIESLKTSGENDEKIYDRRAYLIPTLQEHVANEVENQAEQIFRKKLDSGEIQFDLEVGKPNYKLRQNYKIEVHANQNQLAKYGKPVQLSLFEPMYEYPSDNELEKNFAHFLDGEKALQWWHRVVARQQGEYYVQGWNKQRIYPDFVAMAKEVEGMTRVLIFETKGPQFEGNRDTKYKRKVLKVLEKAFNATSDTKMRETPTQTGIFRLVFNAQEFQEISAQLNEGRYSTES